VWQNLQDPNFPRLGYGVLLAEPMLEKSRPFTSNMTRRESTALKSLKNKKIQILQAYKGKCIMVLNKSTYKEKTSSLLESGVYEILRKDPTSKIERKIWKLLTKHELSFPLH
jgi:hypothetical protein